MGSNEVFLIVKKYLFKFRKWFKIKSHLKQFDKILH